LFGDVETASDLSLILLSEVSVAATMWIDRFGCCAGLKGMGLKTSKTFLLGAPITPPDQPRD
jgi:hypothetical protein